MLRTITRLLHGEYHDSVLGTQLFLWRRYVIVLLELTIRITVSIFHTLSRQLIGADSVQNEEIERPG